MQPPELISKPSGIPLPPREGWTFPMKHTHIQTHTFPMIVSHCTSISPKQLSRGRAFSSANRPGRKQATNTRYLLHTQTQTHRHTDTQTHGHTQEHTHPHSHTKHTHTHSHTHTLIHFSTTVSHLGNMYRFATWQDIWREYRR
jgi:hypothetical protein